MRQTTCLILVAAVLLAGCAAGPSPGGAADAQARAVPSALAATSEVSIAEEAQAVIAEEQEFRTPSGYKKKKRGDTTVYCRYETPIGTRFPTEYCFTRNQLERVEKSKQGMQDDVAMRQRMCTTQKACGEF
jgi:invasion protein IalB